MKSRRLYCAYGVLLGLLFVGYLVLSARWHG